MKKKIVFKKITEMPPMAISLDTMDWNKTGSWRYMRPMYQYKTAPCTVACPASEKISRYLLHIARREYEEAWTMLIRDNPFPAVCGRVCRHPCEAVCNRAHFDQPISIRALERHIGDWGREHGSFKPVILEKEKRVAVVGAGASGLSAAFFLRLEGYGVDVYEAMRQPGGIMRHMIPSYRLPGQVLDDEIETIRKTGVNIRTGVQVGKDISFDELLSYDAVVLAVGAWQAQKMGVEGEEMHGVYSDWELLRSVKKGESLDLGKRTAVIGTGDSALDSARSLVRLGRDVVLVTERTRGGMPQPLAEIEDAVMEGVDIRERMKPLRIILQNDRVRAMECIEVELDETDESGRQSFIAIEGSDTVFKVDSVIECVNSIPDFAFLPDSFLNDEGAFGCDERGATAHEKVFIVGDAVSGAYRSVAEAVGSGKRMAGVVGAYLEGKPYREPKPKQNVVRYDTLNTLYFRKQEREPRDTLAPRDAKKTFDELEFTLGPLAARREAGRCMNCGVCTQCDNCLIFCPDVAISRVKKGYRIDYDFCKGCGICVHECPRNCMTLVEEMKWKK